MILIMKWIVIWIRIHSTTIVVSRVGCGGFRALQNDAIWLIRARDSTFVSRRSNVICRRIRTGTLSLLVQ